MSDSRTSSSPRMHFVPAGSGPCITSTGQAMFVKLASGNSSGELTVIEGSIAANDGPPLHVHEHENETYYVLEGTFEFVCGPDEVRGGPGTFVFAPRGIPHRYRNIGTATGRILFGFTPAGIEEFFIAISREHDPGRKFDIARKFGITMFPRGS